MSSRLWFIGTLFGFLLLRVGVAAVTTETLIVPLWPAGAPGAVKTSTVAETQTLWNNDPNWPILQGITQAQLELFFPKSEGSSQAVVICPGGGYYSLNIEKEGRAIARWLADRGIVGCVLKYRLPNPAVMEDRTIGPLQDGQEAIRVLRRRAKEWNIAPQRIGIMGFSSGGHLAASVATLYSESVYKVSDMVSARPDFVILVYPVISMRPENTPNSLRHALLGDAPAADRVQLLSPELHVTPQTPPAFIAHGKDDSVVPSAQSARFADALAREKVPVELHLYEHGEHAFALGALPDWPKQWPQDLARWLGQLKE